MILVRLEEYCQWLDTDMASRVANELMNMKVSRKKGEDLFSKFKYHKRLDLNHATTYCTLTLKPSGPSAPDGTNSG